MENKPIDHVLGVLIVLLVIFIRTLAPEALTGDLLLVTVLVFATLVELPLLLTVLAVAVLWLTLYSGLSLAILLLVILALAVFLLRHVATSRWRPWVLGAGFSVVGTLIFNGVLHGEAFMKMPGTVPLATLYAFLYSVLLFGILREIYVRPKR